MNRSRLDISLFALPVLFGVLLAGSPLGAQYTSQTLTLKAGWNAVWLEVQPTHESGDRAGLPMGPEEVFHSNPEIITVASPKPLAGLAELFADAPSQLGTFNQEGWEDWHRPAIPGDNLTIITGNRPYLIEASADVELTVEGKVRFFRPTWQADRYNLVGFGLSDSAPPTFSSFFAPSGSRHAAGKIYRLNQAGAWQKVNPGAPMASNEAYWIFSEGPSKYMGPVAVDFDGSMMGVFSFGGPGDAVSVGSSEMDLSSLVFTNLSTAARIPEMEFVTNLGAAPGSEADLEIRVVTPASEGLSWDQGNRVDSIPDDHASSALGETVGGESSAILTLGADAGRSWEGPDRRTNLYRLRTGDGGAEFWLPVRASKEMSSGEDSDGTTTPDSEDQFVGLWVGDIRITAVTSIVEDGVAKPSAGSAPLRILLHSDHLRKVSLLSQVTIMQTRSADPQIVPVPVLVVDQRKIPFFEGIRERNGKRVGVRLEAVAFDMPRKGGADTEEYDLTFQLKGSLGSGKTVETFELTPLIIDPRHRSNPFRHAFHQNHQEGPEIRRKLLIEFDAEQPISGRLKGRYTETITGLIAPTLNNVGTIEISRISKVATLE